MSRGLRLRGQEWYSCSVLTCRLLFCNDSIPCTLARAARITKQSMSALVDHLEKAGYVERVEDPHDARASLVRLTSRGRAFGRAVRTFVHGVEADWAERVGARRMEELRAALELLRASLLASED